MTPFLQFFNLNRYFTRKSIDLYIGAIYNERNGDEQNEGWGGC